MKTKIYKEKDLLASLTFIFFGVMAFWINQDYPRGTIIRTGPGYFPMILSTILTILGLFIFLRSFWLNEDLISSFAFRPLLFIIIAILSFAFLIRPLGIVLATLVMIIFSSLAGWDFRWREVLILYLFLVIFSYILFIYFLGISLKVWPI